MTPLIFGLAGLELSDAERGFFGEVRPAGYILFRRNVVDRAQLRALTDALRTLDGRENLPILIDQEGGRVARMQPPEWPAFPPGAAFDRLYERAPISAIEAIRANATALGLLLREVGVTVDCLPLLDVRQPGAHDIIGDRALGAEPLRVAALGRATLEGLRAGGVVGVVKHVPGHGRALADSHVELPVVDADEAALADDLFPFERLNDAPMAMTAHVVYRAWDAAALRQPLAHGDRRDRARPDRLRRAPDVRRSRHARAQRHVRRADGGRARRRLRSRAALLGLDGRDGGVRGRGRPDRCGGVRPARSGDGDDRGCRAGG